MPDWLKQPIPTPAFSEPPVLAEPELPDWLKQIEPSLATQAPPVSLPESQIPGWLQQTEPAATELPAMSAAEVPDWLIQPGPTPMADESRAPAQAELPDWLQQLPPVAESPALLEPEKAAGPAPDQEAAVSEPEAGAALPDWLQELEAEPAQPAPVGEPAAWVGEQTPRPSVELPDWLKELGPSAEPSPIETGLSAPPPVAGGLVAAQIPAWLQSMRPQQLSPQEPEQQEPVESEGLLAGVAGVLQAAEIVKRRAAGPARSLAPEIPAADRARAGALQEILAGGTVPIIQREPESRAQRLWNTTQRLIVFLLVLAAVLLPLGQERLGLNISWVGAPSLTPSAGQLYDAIDKLDPDSPVLVSVDYDATQSAEMDVQALVLLRHLAARQAKVRIVSLYPTGPVIAQLVVDRLNQTLTGDGQLQVENLGYVPGQDTGIAFIQDLAASSALVIELAATPDTVRWWAEQTTAQAYEKPLLVGVSAAAEPMSLPYYYGKRSSGLRQITGMLAGVPDATAYRQKLDAQLNEQDRARLLAPVASISLANTLLAALIVIGALVQLVAGGGKRR